MAQPYNIGIFVADGDPDGVRIVHRPGWTWRATVFRRVDWAKAYQISDLKRPGVYILHGYGEESADIPLLYIGMSDDLSSRLDTHVKNTAEMGFWDRAVAFTSIDQISGSQARWLEHRLIAQALDTGVAQIVNRQAPSEPPVSMFERADMLAVLPPMLQMLRLLDFNVFEKAPRTPPAIPPTLAPNGGVLKTVPLEDTLIVPGYEDGFQEAFLGERAWWAVRIAEWRLPTIKWLAVYRTAPHSRITHVGRVQRIEPYGDSGKYKLFLDGEPEQIGPVLLAPGTTGLMGTKYTTIEKLRAAKTTADL
jgi:hypothetical protein